ncbi:hypothetical protein BDW68DRAFT_135060 [Aspergillus falconensis]
MKIIVISNLVIELVDHLASLASRLVLQPDYCRMKVPMLISQFPIFKTRNLLTFL